MFPTILFIAALCSAQPNNKDVDIKSLNEHVKKMDAVLQEVQSHSQAQEQKYSAVLSSVLSQLTQTTEELSKSKNITEELQLEVQKMKEINNSTLLDYTAAIEELAELKQSHNKTLMDMAEMNQSHNKTLMDMAELKHSHNKTLMDMAEMNQSHNKTLMDMAELKQSHNKTLMDMAKLKQSHNKTLIELTNEVNSLQVLVHKDVGFEAFLGKNKNVSEGRIVFDMVNYNQEKGYNNTTGKFTAPVSGTYLFWTNIVYRSNKSPIMFRIRTHGNSFGYAYGVADETHGRASGMALFYLKQGEEAWVYAKEEGEFLSFYSSVGAVLITQY